MELQALERFNNLPNDFRITKMASKRPNSYVGVGESRTGGFALIKWSATDKLPEQTGVMVDSLRTSPIVKIVDFGETHTIFETEGGVYKLEKIEENPQ
jgi:hypothetical protein